MDSTLTQILALYDSAPDLSPADIGEALNLAPEVVDAVLRIHSPEYRAQIAQPALEDAAEPTQEQAIKSLEIDADVVAALKEQLIQSALRSDNEGLRVKTAKYLVEEATGRNHARAFRQNKTIINNNITAVNARFEQLKRDRRGPRAERVGEAHPSASMGQGSLQGSLVTGSTAIDVSVAALTPATAEQIPA